MTAEAPDAASPDALWSDPPPARRGPKPKHTLEGITDAAVAIADADGLAVVTMQRVAERLGTTKMALYRYLPGRADLDAAMLDRALGAPPPASDAAWREALASWTRALHARALVHPWAVELAQRPHLPGPQELTWYELGLRATAELRLTGGERLDLLALLSGHALSLVRQRSAAPAPEEELAARLGPVLAAHSETFPHTVAAFADAGRGGGRDDALDFGVQRILAGIDALVRERGMH